MKLNIYSKGNGWYVPIGNYKNKEEKPIFMNLRFPPQHCPEPNFVPDNSGSCKKTIIVNEGSFNKYINDKNELKLNLTIFNYEIPSSTSNNLNFTQDDLPFL